MPAASTSMPSVQVPDFEDIGLLIRHGRLVWNFWSSGQRFACAFLQIPPRDGHPCRPANSSPGRAGRGLPPPSGCALPSVPQSKNPGRQPGLLLCSAGQQPGLQYGAHRQPGQFHQFVGEDAEAQDEEHEGIAHPPGDASGGDRRQFPRLQEVGGVDHFQIVI